METSTLHRSHKTLTENNKKNSCNSSLHIKLSCMPVTMVRDLQRSPHLRAPHCEVHTIINSNFTNERTSRGKVKQKTTERLRNCVKDKYLGLLLSGRAGHRYEFYVLGAHRMEKDYPPGLQIPELGNQPSTGSQFLKCIKFFYT